MTRPEASRLNRLSGDLLIWASFCLATMLAVQSGFATGLIDTDYLWHIETGRWILAEGRLPEGDIFSFSFQGEPWVLHEWLAQCLIFLVYDYLGQAGLLLFAALFSGSALFLVYRLAERSLKRPLVSLALTLLLSAGLLNFVSPRPQVISYLLFALWLSIIWRARYEGREKSLLFTPVIMAFWVNLHGGYLIGVAFLLAFALLDGASYLLAADRGGVTRRYLRYLWAALALSLAALLLNPDGPERLTFPFHVMTMAANGSIPEWNSFDFHGLDGKLLLAGILLYVCLAALRARRGSLSEIVVPLTTIAAACMASRHAPFASLVLVPYAAQALADNKHYAAMASAEAEETAPLLKKLLPLGALLSLLLLFASPLNPRFWERMESVTPNALLDFMRAAELQGRMFNPYPIGGLLIHALPDYPVLIDSRADLYGDAFIEKVRGAAEGRDGWREALDEWDIQYLFLYRDETLAVLLSGESDFARVKEDKGFVLFVRRAGPNARLIGAGSSKG